MCTSGRAPSTYLTVRDTEGCGLSNLTWSDRHWGGPAVAHATFWLTRIVHGVVV